MSEYLKHIIRSGSFNSDHETYYIIQLVPNAITLAAGIVAEIGEAFSALIVDTSEVTLVLEEEAYQEYQKRLRDHNVSTTTYKLITFSAQLDFELVGFMAMISGELAEQNISILTYAAFSTDHFLVTTEQFELAMTTLQHLQSSL